MCPHRALIFAIFLNQNRLTLVAGQTNSMNEFLWLLHQRCSLPLSMALQYRGICCECACFVLTSYSIGIYPWCPPPNLQKDDGFLHWAQALKTEEILGPQRCLLALTLPISKVYRKNTFPVINFPPWSLPPMDPLPLWFPWIPSVGSPSLS